MPVHVPLHPQIQIAGYGYEALVDEGIAADVLMLWRRRIPTFASCQGPLRPGEDFGSRYIACGKTLAVARTGEIAVKLGWVDHVVWLSPGRWRQEATVFYGSNATVLNITGCERVLLMPRFSPSPTM